MPMFSPPDLTLEELDTQWCYWDNICNRLSRQIQQDRAGRMMLLTYQLAYRQRDQVYGTMRDYVQQKSLRWPPTTRS